MASTQVPKKPNPPITKDVSGIALFMVISAVSVLAILVTEFTYIAQVNERIAYDGLDQLKAHYLAKSGVKFSLLRLKAYQQVKSLVGTMGGGAGKSAVPNSVLEKIWNFPFFYPLPLDLPGLTPANKDAIKKFQDESGFEGRYSALIESESARLNLNSILAAFAPSPSPSASASPKPSGGLQTTVTVPVPNPNPTPSASPSFKPEEARKNLADYMFQIWNNRVTNDQDFAAEYRDLRFDDFMDGIYAWADRGYERRTNDSRDPIKSKRAPFYSITEMHMIPLMDDQLYNLFTPGLTISKTTGININTMQETTLRALVANLTDEEVKNFFKDRDNPDPDGSFNSAEDFYKWLSTNTAAYRSGTDPLKKSLSDKNVQLLTEENQFKITVQAQVNQATRLIEAWVTLNPDSGTVTTGAGGAGAKPSPTPSSSPQNPGNNGTPPPPDPGLRITFMRFL